MWLKIRKLHTTISYTNHVFLTSGYRRKPTDLQHTTQTHKNSCAFLISCVYVCAIKHEVINKTGNAIELKLFRHSPTIKSVPFVNRITGNSFTNKSTSRYSTTLHHHLNLLLTNVLSDLSQNMLVLGILNIPLKTSTFWNLCNVGLPVVLPTVDGIPCCIAGANHLIIVYVLQI